MPWNCDEKLYKIFMGLGRLRKQPDSTWHRLQKCLITLPDLFNNMFENDVHSFMEKKAHLLRTNLRYIPTSLITSTRVISSQEMALNIFSVFGGPPTAGKLQALRECVASSMSAVCREIDSETYIINKCTSSGPLQTMRKGPFYLLKFMALCLNC